MIREMWIGGFMRFFVVLAFFCTVVLGAGCATSRVVVEDSHAPDVIIDRFGDITFQGKRVAPEKIASAVTSAKIPKKHKVRILIPENPDRDVMGKVAGYLHLAGYGTVFVTDRKASIDLKKPVN